jgi:hypothetical protein
MPEQSTSRRLFMATSVPDESGTPPVHGVGSPSPEGLATTPSRSSAASLVRLSAGAALHALHERQRCPGCRRSRDHTGTTPAAHSGAYAAGTTAWLSQNGLPKRPLLFRAGKRRDERRRSRSSPSHGITRRRLRLLRDRHPLLAGRSARDRPPCRRAQGHARP